MNINHRHNWVTLLRRMFGKTKAIKITLMTKEEWENVISKFDVEFVAVTIDCFSYRKKRRHYNENIPKVINHQKTIFDMTNYPGYVIIYMSRNDDLSTLCETYNNIYRLYGNATKIELLAGFFYKDKDSGDPTNVIDFSLKDFPIAFTDFKQIINSRYL